MVFAAVTVDVVALTAGAAAAWVAPVTAFAVPVTADVVCAAVDATGPAAGVETGGTVGAGTGEPARAIPA
ncbi:MAG: hypothetical protein E6G24_10015 [Actinobacteria bacterium]|nr:MAG: hypothetical protein E6G24_10015 [Actinomycetota bacterium]